MKNLKFYIILLAVIVTDQRCFSQKPDTAFLNTYLVLAAKNNPELKAAFNMYLAALEKVPQLGSLSDPTFSMGVFIQPMELVDGNQIADFRLMQMFPWFGTLKTAKDEASMMAKAKYEEFNTVKADLFFRVKSSWYQILKYDQEIKLQRENITLLESLEQIAMIKFQNPAGSSNDQQSPSTSGNAVNPPNTQSNSVGSMGGGNMQTGSGNNQQSGNIMPSGTSSSMGGNDQSGLTDVLRVKMEILEQKDQLALLLDQKKTEEANFNALLNRDQNIEVKINDSIQLNTLSLGQIALIDTTLSKNPMLAMLDAESQSYLLMQKKARKMGLPMYGIGVDYSLIQKRDGNSSMMNGKDMVMPMFSITLPIYRKKYNAMQNEAKYMYEATLLEKENTKNMLQVQSRQVIQDLTDALRRVRLYTELVSLSKKTSSLLLSGYTTGGTSYEEVLRTQYKVLDYNFKYIDAIIDYNTAVARAEKLMNSVNY
ncbi:MAG: TolC family protein [Bacteroidales bacterium]|jgi:outer membrane protein TolC|nr:TolC family protein [Bacteroidales bacterium]